MVPTDAARWVARVASRGVETVAICTGAFVLGRAGLLDDRACTTHWKRTTELQAAFPRARVREGRLFVEDGPVVTSGGLTAGIDLALHLVDRDFGPSFAARDLTVEAVAAAVGFSDGRQLRRLWQQRFGTSPRTAGSRPLVPLDRALEKDENTT